MLTNDDTSFEQPSADADRLSKVDVRGIVTHMRISVHAFLCFDIFFAFHEADGSGHFSHAERKLNCLIILFV